jgi:hypothetical protein
MFVPRAMCKLAKVCRKVYGTLPLRAGLRQQPWTLDNPLDSRPEHRDS